MGFWRTKELTFILGNTCNLECIYCYPGEYKYGNLKLDINFAKRGVIDFLIKDSILEVISIISDLFVVFKLKVSSIGAFHVYL